MLPSKAKLVLRDPKAPPNDPRGDLLPYRWLLPPGILCGPIVTGGDTRGEASHNP